MTETTVIVGVVIGAAVALLFGRVAVIERRLNRLSTLDAKLDTLLRHAGITFNEYENVPPEVAEAVRRGETILAIKRFREATGLGLKEAKDYVDELKRRTTS